MSKLIKATDAAEAISKAFNIPLSDLVEIFADIPDASEHSTFDILTQRNDYRRPIE